MHGFERPLPLCGRARGCIVHVPQAQDTNQVLVQHAGGDVEQDENASTVHSHTGNVAAITTGLPEGRHVLPRRPELIAAGLEPLRTFLQSLDIGAHNARPLQQRLDELPGKGRRLRMIPVRCRNLIERKSD